MKDRFTREKAAESSYETQTRQSRLITETVYGKLKGQRDSINKMNVYYAFFAHFEKNKNHPRYK